jgi:2-polyprenyl-6-methoxyphenol hydroxylase-like FAD-dependent oxidoreductase
MDKKKKIIINGGGICGLTTAIALQNLGFEIEIYEVAAAFKAVGAGLVLSANALEALKAIGILASVTNVGNNIEHFYIKSDKGGVLSETNSPKVVVSANSAVRTISIHRADLHQVLLDQLNDSVKLFTKKKAIGFNSIDNKVELVFEDGTKTTGDYLLACDGIHSNIRKQLVPNISIRYAGYTCWRGVLEHNIENFDTTFATETWGKNGRFGVVPLTKNRIYWFACINSKKAENEFYKTYSIQQLQENYKEYHFPISEALLLTKQENIFWDDISDFKPLKKLAFGNVLLMGDAGHATTPNMGQGACQAIEDAAILKLCFKKETTIEIAFESFEQLRLPRTTQIVNNSWTFGKLAQISNGLGINMRNFMIKHTPESVTKKQIDFLYNVSFD